MRPKTERTMHAAFLAIEAHLLEARRATPKRQRELLTAIAQVAGHAAWEPEPPQQIGGPPPLRIQADRGNREGDR